MPKLYYTATSCGAASFIAAFTAGLALECETVDLGTHKTASGADFYQINPKGNVPTIVLDDGTVLNEGAATLAWIGDQPGGASIFPALGTSKRYEVIAALNYVASEVHANFGPLFNPSNSAEIKDKSKENLAKKFTYLESVFDKTKFLTGDSFTIADSYLYIVLSWCGYVGVDMSSAPKVQAYFDAVKSLPNVAAAHERIATNPATTF